MPLSSFRPGCPLCGPKLSAFCMLISVWGVIFLGILGLFFYLNATTLFPDILLPEKEAHTKFERGEIVARFTEKATQCWIAAGLYLITLVAVFWQNKWNTQSVF
uniref:Ribonuclease kappa n=1 Tax=Plectus sambesii TaxID=2011161 RepID=A0A914VH84_9BILA